jgi:hypothetical protein
VTLCDGITEIGDWAFRNCKNLSQINIPNSVISICDRAFYGCTSLTSISFDGTVEQWTGLTKAENWANNVPATYVQCTDGTVSI